VQPSVELEVIESRIVERAQEERWDLIVLEASGAWRGSNLTKTLRAQGVKAPILQLNGYADDIDEASQAGADCVILLPFMPLAFRDAMADLIGI
jgi:DNA-binding NarL/FixJ family response regulator